MPTVVTDPRGCSFLSYRRTRSKEAAMLIRAQRERGIPTWQDISNLDEGHTSTELREVLEDFGTANAVLWITPEVRHSSVIREVEAPSIMQRAEAADSFFVIPVAAGNADYSVAADAIGPDVSLTSLEEWNIRRVKNEPARPADVREIANRVLARRVRAIHDAADSDEPVSLGLFVRTAATFDDSDWLSMDWSGRFDGRHATETTWNRHLIAAASDVVDAIEQNARGRQIVVSGNSSIAAAFVLGRTMLAPRALDVSWNQFTPGTGLTPWSLAVSVDDVEISTRTRDSDTSADDLAVLVSVNASVDQAWRESKESLPSFRGIVEVRYDVEGRPPLSAGQALRFAQTIVEEIRAAREKLRPKGVVHLFMAAPVGLSFLVGQLSNTLGPIRVYEHDDTTAVGCYVGGPLVTQ